MTSLRRRISMSVVGITSGVVLVAALGIWMATRTVVLAGVDRELAQRVERYRRIDAASTGGNWRHRPSQTATNEARDRTDPRRYVQIIALADGRELSLADPVLDGARIGEGEGPAITVLNNGHRVRSVGIQLKQIPPFIEVAGENYAVPCIARLGIDLEQMDAELSRMGSMLAAMWLTATVLAWGSVILLGSAILRPVRELGEAIDRLGPDDLAARVPATSGPDEVRGMVDRLNGLLDRLEQAFRREQATIASVAHELRTPVAALRSDIEFRLLA
ncbi:MAG: HAMP domain-containing protein, partial [Planctomycetota bacterium]